jgi:Domain of unknown function DUF29
MTTHYDADFYAWTQAQADALRAKQWNALDLDHLAEEIQELGNEQEHAVVSHLRNLTLHLLKVAYQRQRRLTWLRSIRNAREEIEWRLQRSPSLRPRLPEFLAWAYPRARKAAAEETRLPLATFPDTCPWTLEQLQDDEFLPLLKP